VCSHSLYPFIRFLPSPTESIKYNILGLAYVVLTAVLATVFVKNMAFDLLVVSLNMYNLLGSMLMLSMRIGRKNKVEITTKRTSGG
jgi:hypothetical protein